MSARTRAVAVAVKASSGICWIASAQRRELAVLGAEVVPPLGYAVGLVDDEGADAGSYAQALQRAFEKIGEQQTLRSEIEELVFTPQRRRQATVDLIGAERRVDEARGDAVILEQPHLILHERDQRRDHDAQPGLEHSRQLKAERLAAAGRHEREHVFARQHIAHDVLLAGTEMLESENAVQCCGQVGHGAAFYRTMQRASGAYVRAARKNLIPCRAVRRS